MKKHIFIVFLLICFSDINYIWAETIKKVCISDGLINYCQLIEEPNAAVVLHVIDLESGKKQQHYLPGSLCFGPPDTSNVVRFPLTWSTKNRTFLILFPNLLSDAMGRISFRIWTTEDVWGLKTQEKYKGFTVENQIMRYKGYWYGQPVYFMNSIPFSTNLISNDTNNIWYEANTENIIVRIPLQKADQKEWVLVDSPKLYRWIKYSVSNKQTVSIEDNQHNDITPLAGIQVKGKKILSDDENTTSANDADWIIWGTDHEGNAKILQMSDSKELSLIVKNCIQLPKIILSNEDSDYIIIFYKNDIIPSDVTESMDNIIKFLNNKKLIKKYPKRSEHSELDIPSSNEVTTLQRGLLDPPPPEEQERLKREFIASQPLNELFSKEELEKLFVEPDYTQLTDLLKQAQAYDWSGKYAEALDALKKAKGIEAEFELARFLKYGRPEIPADNKKSNQLFSEVVLFVETKSSIPSSEEYCLAGRACREFQPANWDETIRWKKKAGDFFQKAISQGYLPAYYYSQYYERHSSNNKPDDLLKSLSSDNLEAKVFIAGLAATNQYFKKYRNREENLKVIKEAVLTHNNLAQCVLGMLYLVSDTDPNAFLRHDRRKAKFWLQRAADRGDQDAKEILKNDSRLKFSKKE